MLRAALAAVESVSTEPGRVAFRNDISDDPSWLRGSFFCSGARENPCGRCCWREKRNYPFPVCLAFYVLERLFDTASAAVIAAVALLLFRSHAHAGETASKLETAARTTGSLLFAGVIGAIAFLVYLRLHGTALLERRLQGWLKAHGWRGSVAEILLGFTRGVQDDSELGRPGAVDLLLGGPLAPWC